MNWEEEKTLDFIEDYRSYPVLWQSSHKDYKSRPLRKDACAVLGDKYGMDAKSVLNKIKALRSYFHREHAKVVHGKAGDSPENSYTSGWFAYRQLLFILENDETKIKNEEGIEVDDALYMPINPYLENHDSDSGTNDNPSRYEEAALPKSKKRKSANVEEQQPVFRMVRDRYQRDDHFSYFSDYLASRLRRLDNAHLQNMAEHRLNTVMNEIESMSTGPCWH